MSFSRNTKRKRSKAGAPATSSTRDRAVAAEPAHEHEAATTTRTSSSTSRSTTSSSSTAEEATASPSTSRPITTKTKTRTRTATSSTTTLPTGVGSSSDSGTKTSDGMPTTEGTLLESQSSKQSAEKGGMKHEAHVVAEPTSNTTGVINGKSAEPTGKMAATTKSTTSTTTDTTTTTTTTPATKLGTSPIDASSSSTSSQDGTSTRRQALHIANDDDDREKRMYDLICHRSILLDRVRACRASAENRIGEKHEGNTTTTNTTTINANANANDDLADNQEIAAFRFMTKQANQAARKNREADGVGEKRTSLSLRRGSSVGKRMNAALSTLVPGSNVAGAAGSGAHNATTGQTTTSTVGKSSSMGNLHHTESKADAKGASTPFTKYSTAKSSGRLPINNLSNDSSSSTGTTIQTAPTTSIKSNANSKSNKAYSPFPSQSTKQSDAPTRGRPPNSKNTKMKTGAVQTGTPHSLASAQHLKKNSALQVGARPFASSMMAAAAGAGPNSLAAKQGPKVKFPEAMMLREEREQIESKLRKLLERRQNDGSVVVSSKILSSSSSSGLEDETTRRKSNPSGAVTSKPPSNKKMLHPALNAAATNRENGLEISSPAPLPNRRRTHWDTVLQEMAWLASDFMEERKWKLSTSRLISSNIPLHGLSDRRKRSSEAHRGGNDTTTTTAAAALRELPSDTNKNTTTTTGNSSSTHSPEHHKKGARLSKKKDARREYSAPVTDDEEMAKCRSQILSCMISKLDAAIKKGGSLEVSDKHHQEALKHFVKSRSDIIRNTKNPNDPMFANDSDIGSDPLKDNKSDSTTDEDSTDKSRQKGPSFDSVDEYISHFHSTCKAKHKLAAKETAKALKSGKIKLSGKQKEMLEFVDKVWSAKPHSGAVVFGSPISGMTFGAATVIWKQRTQGSQILICPSRSLIRWKYELNRFSNIRVLTFGSTGGISNPDGDNDTAEIQSTDVILCEYASVNRMKNALKKLGVCPFSVIVDLRHFVGLRKSLRAPTSGGSTDFPLELLSNSWWGDIVTLVRNREVRCLLLEYYDSDSLSLSNCGLGQKDQISILAKRAACIIGPELFDSRSHSIEREVITWARKKGKKDIIDKALRVKKVIYDAVNPMCFRVTKSIVSSFDFEWELRSCEMSAAQRKEYERCCYEVRGALSSTFEESNSNGYHYSVPVVSNALFRLRQLCFYSRKDAMQSYSESHDESPTLIDTQHEVLSDAKKESSNFWVNSSQPDADKAYSIINSSSKLKELVSILMSEGGYKLNFDESTKKIFGIFTGAKKVKDAKRSVKKIVIFAALPYMQHVVSTLLNSLGIQNELICRYEPHMKSDKHNANLDKRTKKFEAIAWAKSQSVLSRFCGDNHCRKTNIIIASPATLSGRNDGIGVEGADIIITLDSDWSGRDGFIIDSLVKRWHAKNKLASKEDKLIRLVCADSIEAKIFDDDRDNGVLSWPLDINGFFTLPISQDEASVLYKQSTEDDSLSCCSFPALGVLQNRGDLLEDVLALSSRLPSLFGSGKPATFLPRRFNEALADQEITAELHFLKYFMHNEKHGSASTKSSALAKLSMASQISCAGLTSRKDMSVIESRLFLEKLINSCSPLKDLDDHPAADAFHSNVILLNVAQAPGESPNPNIDENPSSLLFYEPYQEFLTKKVRSKLFDANGNKAKRRCNAYAKLFSSSWNGISIRDGNQGCEPLVFFPPLFPLLEEVSKKARTQYTSSTTISTDSQGIVNSTGNSVNNPTPKRKDREFAAIHNDIKHDSKRSKTQSVSEHDINGHPGLVPSLVGDMPELSSKTPSTSGDQLVPQNGKVRRGSLAAEKRFKSNEPCSSGLVMMGEDFGLLGSGAFPTPTDAISFSAHDTKENSSYISSWNRPDYGSYLIPCDAEETSTSAIKDMDEGMQSVLLFVKKRPRSIKSAYKHGQGLSSIVPLPIGSKFVGDESGKKMKKRITQGNSQLPPTAFTRLPGNLSTQHSQILPRTSIANPRQVKGDFRHKLLSSFFARQRATGLTLFDSIPYRVAAMRVEKRVIERLEKLMWKSTLTLDVGPGLPIQFVEKSCSIDKSQSDHRQSLASIVDLLKDGSPPGGAARKQSSVQKVEFKRSSVSPRCVDFGTFAVGYLGSPSGMTGIPTARLRVGVSLPMGVKVMQPTKDQEKRSAWNVRGDKILQDAAKKFGMNWLLVASATSGFEHAVIKGNIPDIEKIVPSVAKSARQCRDRWQLLAQSRPSVVNKVRRYDAVQNIEVSGEKGKASIYSADNINIICKSDDFQDVTKKESTLDTDMHDVDEQDSVSAKQSGILSPRSTVDKEDDNRANEHNLTHDISGNTNDTAGGTADVQMPDASKTTKSTRRSFSAISIARSRRLKFPVTIPGVDVGGNQAGHPVPSHPSHMQSVQISVAAQWSSGRTEMWPLQILDLADKQRSGASRINNMQRGEIPTGHNSSRRHPTGSSSYQHRPQPSQSSAVRAVGYSSGLNSASRPVAPRPVNASVPPHHQHRNQQVAAATVQAYIPPQTTTTGKAKKGEKQKPTNKTSPTKG